MFMVLSPPLSVDDLPEVESSLATESQANSADDTAEKGSPEKTKKIGLAPVPIIFYTFETSLAFGGGIIFTFRDPDRPDDKRRDNLQVIAAYTLKNQAFLSLSPEVHCNEKRGKLVVQTSYADWPTRFSVSAMKPTSTLTILG